MIALDEWLTVGEVAKQVKVKPETVRRWLRGGQLVGSILSDSGGWRVRQSELNRFMAERETPAEGEDSARR